jgi:hypothetical protein
MKARVFVLRRNGRRFQDRSQEGIDGDLRMHSVMRGSETHRIVQLCSRADRSSKDEELLPPLYEPQLMALGNGALLLRGFESYNGVGYVQEWRCEIPVDPDEMRDVKDDHVGQS